MRIHQQDFARQLRFEPTSAERKLWGYLRKRSLEGFRFNRQVAIGPYVVDFLCREKRLIVEVDGATHGETHEVKYDERRSVFLVAQGFHVVRVGNGDVYHNVGGVIESLMIELERRGSFFKGKRPPQSLRDSSPNKLVERS
jgi:very-short-patch-repair endonuclease